MARTKEFPKVWLAVASGDSASSLAMYQRDYEREGRPVKVEKDVNGRFRLYVLTENRLHEGEMNTYMAVAKGAGRYEVRQIPPGCHETYLVGDCRDFATFEEADDVARKIAAGEFPDIRPAGIYVCNR